MARRSVGALDRAGHARVVDRSGRVAGGDPVMAEKMRGRAIVLLIEDEDFAWEVLNAASEQLEVARAVMVNPDHPHSVASVVSEPT